MVQKLKKRTEGFTIIEVMIVLAIAGLILLIVFLAVPALQRNSRNTQRKTDAAAIAAAAANVTNNTNGNIAKQVAPGDGVTNPAPETSVSLRVSATIQAAETAKLGIFKVTGGGAPTWGTSTGGVFIGDYTGAATLTPVVVAASATETVSNISTESVTVAAGYKCNDTNTDLGTKSNRSVAVLYVNETAGGNGNLQCVQ